MKGLTPEEYARLSQMAGPIRERWAWASRAKDVVLDLEEQGRVVRGPPRLEGCVNGWYLTPAGREALRLYPLMLAVEAA